MAVVKIIYKKGDKNRMSNYRPICIICADYKLLAKIITSRMRPVLNYVIEKDQQGFIKDGDITGNLILVKEIVQYCNEEGKEGALILMDFKKAYDRVDRGLMFKTLEKMNFEPEFVDLVKTLYGDAISAVEVNDELTREILTGGGGVRQDTISLFADDSCICARQPFEDLKEARITMEKYEQASGSALHEGKTKIMKIGKTREKMMTNRQIGVKFTILEDKAQETYLGDIIGNEVTEEQRFDGCLEKMQEKGDRWNRENVTGYGRALVSNTLVMPVILYRGRVNGMTAGLKKKVLKIVKEFVWPTLKWSIALRGIAEGGIGVKDPSA